MQTDAPDAAWDIDENHLSPLACAEARLRFALNYAVLAPSTHNSQPWRFIVDGDTVMLCANRTRALPVVDPFDRELVISCGAALDADQRYATAPAQHGFVGSVWCAACP